VIEDNKTDLPGLVLVTGPTGLGQSTNPGFSLLE